MHTPNPTPTSKIMIIIWRWNMLKQIDGPYLHAHPNWEKEFEQLKGKAFEVIPVQHSPQTQNSYVIRAHLVENEEDTASRKFLYQLLDSYGGEGTHLYLFLHRKNGYSQKTLKSIQNDRSDISRGFIFGEGLGPLYVQDTYGGLLGGKDFFDGWMTMEKGNKRKVSVVEKKEKQVVRVLQPYFDRVWNQHSFPLRDMLVALNQDVLDFLLPFMNPLNTENISLHTLSQRLMREELLCLRIKSFIQEEIPGLDDDDEEDDFMPEEIYLVKLIDFESKHHASYHFKDLKEQLLAKNSQDQGELDTSYKHLCSVLQSLLYPSPEASISQEELRAFRDHFSKLLHLV